MDNITHSLVGAAIAQGAIQWRLHRHRVAHTPTEKTVASAEESVSESATDSAAQHKRTAPAMVLTSIAANNFPDLDLIVTALMEPRFGYILHHRGHTHTLLFVPLQLLMLLGILWLVQRRRKVTWTSSDWRWLAGLAFVGGLVHLGMDSWNVYGVHPFWPLDNRWIYGDFVFILEPLFWFALLPWLAQSAKRRWLRNLLAFFYGLGLIALCVVYLSIWWYPLGLALVAIAYGIWVMRRERQTTRALISFAALAGLIGCMLASSLWTRATLHTALKQAHPQESIRDIALMSYPSNPFCTQWISVSYHAKDGQYVLRKGLYTFFPKAIACRELSQGQTAPMQVDKASLHPRIGGLLGTLQVFRRPLKELRSLAGHCQLEAALQFIRTPYWHLSRDSLLIGDLRFDRRKGFDLAEFRFPKTPKHCPSLRPPWVAPLRTRGLW